MRRVFIVGILALILMSSVGAISYYYHLHPSEATVKKTAIKEYWDGVIKGNGSTLDYGSELEPGEAYSYNYTVLNSGATVVTVRLIIVDLPPTWSLTWDGNNTVLNPGQAVIGDLLLTVGSGAGDGSYTWDHYLEAVK